MIRKNGGVRKERRKKEKKEKGSKRDSERKRKSLAWWCMSIIPAIWVVEAAGS
jgi:hypothetical protein